MVYKAGHLTIVRELSVVHKSFRIEVQGELLGRQNGGFAHHGAVVMTYHFELDLAL
jgi:hypothetical protein